MLHNSQACANVGVMMFVVIGLLAFPGICTAEMQCVVLEGACGLLSLSCAAR